ncbi:hypothetical protein C9374_006402 [Naegleria lovaniensis]|uniref:Carboxylesterase type B domain-containing protein n=1 Tax=Naegleria lovaniensis TaxID=51637 RepID=A0AA88GMS1_NAELO|nr:uncharacterized protein C9374_006402 [Naegleria lovaniensis]KAG2381413.1 hypothetical protein C9374_006402 [Naegleria lovaniensis]
MFLPPNSIHHFAKRLSIVLLLVSVLFLWTPYIHSQQQPLVTLSNGAILQGKLTENNQVKAFLGIRYASDTSGANRWQLPQPYHIQRILLHSARCSEFW